MPRQRTFAPTTIALAAAQVPTMLRSLKDLFDHLLSPPAALPPAAAQHQLQLAVAVLLVEVMRADTHVADSEHAAALAALREKFQLSPDEAARLVELGEAAARQSVDFYTFTSQLNERYTPEQKLRMVELMWSVAYADGRLADHERHTLWRVADLLNVPQGAYVLARQRAAEAATGAIPP
jgi:uncharacterized tellurite resistance protein B-like protein